MVELMPNFSGAPGASSDYVFALALVPQAREHHLWKSKWKPRTSEPGEQGGSCESMSWALKTVPKGTHLHGHSLASTDITSKGVQHNKHQLSTLFMPHMFSPILTEG